MKFKNYIETESGIKDTSTSPGTAGQLLSSTVAGTSWIDQNTISSGTSEVVDIQVKNISSANGGINLSKGDPVYIYGSVGASARLYVDLADADSTATNNLGDGKMPCVGLLDQDLSPNGEGTATVVGKLRNLITNPIDGDVPNENDTVYVKSGGGLTLTKPTGSTNLIQNVGQVGRVSTSADGNIVVAALLRSNDVPNLPEGRIWIGDGNTIVSDTVYVDEPNNRVGINTAMPTYDLDVDGAIRASEGFIDNEDNSALRVVSPPGGSFRSAFTTVGAIEVTIPNSYVKNDVTFTLEVREGGLTAYTIKIAMRGNIGIDLFPYVVSAYLTSDANKDNNCTIKYESLVPEFDDVKIYVQNPSLGFPSNTGVFITEFTVPATVADGNLAWGLNITSVPAEANATFSNTQVTNWKRNGQDLYYGSGSGNVGIGTTSPGAYKLAVAGSTAIGENLQVSDGLGGDRTLDIDAPNGAFRIGDIDGIADEAYIEGTGSTIRISNSGGLTLIADSNQNVGIGAPIPSQKLHVNGNARLTGLFYDGTNSGGASGQILSSDGVKTEWINGSAIPGVPAGSGATNYLARWTPDANTLGIGVTYDNGTNVGIGINQPSAKLHIEDTTPTLKILSNQYYNNSVISMGNGQSEAASITCSNNPGLSNLELRYDNGSTGDARIRVGQRNLDFMIDAVSAMYINSSKNVGIGTTAPGTYKLAVAGSTVIGGNVKVSDGLGGDEVLTLTPNTGSFKIGDIDGVGDEGYIEGDSSSIKFFTGGSQTLVCDINQRVGIGTTTPSEKLVVRNGTSNTDVKILAYNSAAGTEATLKFSTINSETNYEKAAIIARNPDGSWGRSDMHFALDSAEDSGNVEFSDTKMTILNDGNVGIGITDPSHTLEVKGTVLVGDGNTSYLYLHNTGNFLYGDTYGNTIIKAADNFRIQTTGGVERVRVNSSGNVGIFTSDPKTKLHVASASGSDTPTAGTATGGLFVSNTNKTYGVNMGVAGAGWSFIQSQRADGNTTLYNLNLQPLGGNVGIGTTTPDVKFEVESTTSASGIRIKNTNSGYASLDIESNRGTGANLGGLRYKKTGQANSQAEINYVAGTRFDFLLGNGTAALTNKLSILENGNVGINDNTPSYKLDVNGTGRFTSTVTATNFILSSDETLKDNIKEIDTKHVDVDWKNFELKSEPGVKRAGVIAQELEIKHPEFVRTADDGLKSVAYIDLLITKIAELEARLEKLEK